MRLAWCQLWRLRTITNRTCQGRTFVKVHAIVAVCIIAPIQRVPFPIIPDGSFITCHSQTGYDKTPDLAVIPLKHTIRIDVGSCKLLAKHTLERISLRLSKDDILYSW